MLVRCNGCFKTYDSEFGLCPHCGYANGNLPQEVFQLPVGTVLADRYILGNVIGMGGFGITYKAWDKKLDIPVAIKEFYPSGAVFRNLSSPVVNIISGAREKFFEHGLLRFLEEARSMSKFNTHENIINVFEYFEENQTAYIVMEFLDGCTLREYMKSNGKLSIEKSINIIENICKALKDTHKTGIIHRDVNPNNIFLCNNSKIKLIDFGSARFSAQDEEKEYSQVITPGFAPPEQYEQISAQGTWTDIYGLGATFYYMITGQKPEESTNRKINDELVEPSKIDSNIPQYISLSIMKAMAIDRHMRFENVDDFLKAIKKEKKVVSLKAEKRKRKGKRFIGIAACLMIFAAIAAMFTVQMGDESLQAADIDLWYMEVEGADTKSSYENIIKDFSEAYGVVKIKATGIPEAEYEQKLAQAIKEGNAPDVFQSTGISDELLKKATDVSDVVYPQSNTLFSKLLSRFHKQTLDGCGLLSDYNKYFKTPNRVPTSFNVPTIYVNTAICGFEETSIKDIKTILEADTKSAKTKILINSDMKDDIKKIFGAELLENKNVAFGGVEDFAKGETAFFISDTADYYDVRSIGTYCVVKIDKDDLLCDFYDTWSVSKSDEKSEKAAQRFIQFLLSYNAQNQLYGSGNKIKALPINEDALQRFGETFKKINVVIEDTKDFVFEEKQ